MKLDDLGGGREPQWKEILYVLNSIGTITMVIPRALYKQVKIIVENNKN